MIADTLKNMIKSLLKQCGYRIVRDSAQSRAFDKSGGDILIRSHDELVAALPEIIRRAQPIGQPRLADYPLEMATYDLKTVMGDVDPDFFPFFEKCRSYTMTSWQRLYSLHMAVKHVVDAGIEGDLVECGVWRGGSMMMAALTLAYLGQTSRKLYLFDTFEGLPKPDKDKDIDIWGNNAVEAWEPHRKSDESSDWAYASLDEVKSNIASTGYPMDNVVFVKGMVEDTLEAAAPAKISLLRLDTDWYSSTKHEMEVLYPRLSKGGALILDDYGHFKGARQAVDEFFERGAPAQKPLIVRVDYAGRIAVKTT